MTKTITPEQARDLYRLFDDHELLDEEDQSTEHGWTVLGSTPSGNDGRWHERYWMLLRDSDGATWGVKYGVGLTEDQEDDLPWDHRRGPLPLVRLYPHEVRRVEYRTEPQDADVEVVSWTGPAA